jgi:hypothetical protein
MAPVADEKRAYLAANWRDLTTTDTTTDNISHAEGA